MRCVSKVCYLWLAFLFLETVCCSFLLRVLDVSVGHVQVSNQITCGGIEIVACNYTYMLCNVCYCVCSIFSFLVLTRCSFIQMNCYIVYIIGCCTGPIKLKNQCNIQTILTNNSFKSKSCKYSYNKSQSSPNFVNGMRSHKQVNWPEDGKHLGPKHCEEVCCTYRKNGNYVDGWKKPV
jgi:hypothetical protein